MAISKRKHVIGLSAAAVLGVSALAWFWPDSPPPAPAKPPIVIMPVQMPPPPPAPTPEQIAAAEAATLEQARIAEVAVAEKVKAEAKAKAAALAAAKPKPKPAVTKKKVIVSKGERKVTEVAAAPKSEAPKPKEVRFNMSQDGKKMTAEDFDAWMKAQGIRIVPAKPAEPPKTEEKKDGG